MTTSHIAKFLQTLCLIILFHLHPASAAPDCTCHLQNDHQLIQNDKAAALNFKLIAIASILVAGALGVTLPLLGKNIKSLKPESNIFFMIKSFAGGVILATGFIHILPEAFRDLTSPCLKNNPWGKFPFTGFIAMCTSMVTLMIDSLATGYFKRAETKINQVVDKNLVIVVENEVSENCTSSGDHSNSAELVRHRIISQVLELGIVVHSIVIGVSMGASEKPETIKSLLVALSFHQFFEGMGLGGCISQAKFKNRSMVMMAAFFSLTAPVGIGIGMGVSNVYRENSQRSLIVQGTLNSASAGILIYMALVDILAADFMNPRMQSSMRLQLGSYTSLLLGSGCMSFLAKWA
ncbi:unnamed protein product [Rhodiola kirilowii]